MSDALIKSLLKAIQAAPNDIELRLHVAEVLVDQGRPDEAVEQAAAVLARAPGHDRARTLMAAALGAPPRPSVPSRPESANTSDHAPQVAPPGQTVPVAKPPPHAGFDWSMAEEQVGGAAPPMFVDSSPTASDVGDVERVTLRLSDVGGLVEVKERIEASFLAPLRNPELRTMFGVSLRGGLLMYGPPGCGKTFLAKAVAGELEAAFIHVSISDVIDMFMGQSERNIHELFERARASAPCVLFFDEVDALGRKRSLTRGLTPDRSINQLLIELDGVGSSNEGVYVLAATNQPWDVDPAMRRPGRLDRTVLVLPPDLPAREAIFRTHLQNRPIASVDVGRLAQLTEGYSGADVAHICHAAVEEALMDSVRTGTARFVTMADLERAISQVRPSIGPWLDMAENVVLYANTSGEYDDLATYLRRRRR